MNSDQITKEIKFAVVMYGGGSLAIYINGVAQELLKMVQATAGNAGELTGTAIVYRKIAALLSDKKIFAPLSKLENEISKLEKDIKEAEDDVKKPLKSTLTAKRKERDEYINRISVKFVIDVLTGSSAGGINAIFLSKALANGANIEKLQDLWMTQGDFRILLNDKNSVRDNDLVSSIKPKSLLNSQRMYLELLKALDGMEVEEAKPLVENLDLFVTFTDFRGVPLPISLTDQDILERRHRHTFNFRFEYLKETNAFEVNDFERENDPFLAFAARTTSAFPIAFEPMKLSDIDDVLKCSGLGYAENSTSEKWKKYFRKAADEAGKPLVWTNRSFVDGGALDNKPFSYAIDTISQREGSGIVERKLIFIDPFAEEFKKEADETKPNALENVLGQASGLPRYETIREDIERLIKRNHIIRRVKRITSQVEKDFETRETDPKDIPSNIDWSYEGLDGILEYKGSAFLLYYRLRVSSVTDQIGKMAGAYFHIDEDSNHNEVFRRIISLWRDNYYLENKPEKNNANEPEKKIPTLNTFLYFYDVEYRFRRLRQIMQRLEYLFNNTSDIFDSLDQKKSSAARSLELVVPQAPLDKNVEDNMKRIDVAMSNKEGFVSPFNALQEAIRELSERGSKFDESARKAFAKEVIDIKERITKIYSRLRKENNYLHESLKNPLSSPDSPAAKSNTYQNMEDDVKMLKRDFDKIENVLCLYEINKRLTGDKVYEIAALTIKEMEELKIRLSSDDRSNLSEKEKLAIPQLSANALKHIGLSLKNNKSEFEKLDSGNDAEENKKIFKVIFGENYQKMLDALYATGKTLNKVYGRGSGSAKFLRLASDEMKEFLGINDEKTKREGEEEKAFLAKISADKTVANAQFSYLIRVFLRNYYILFDSYDQLSFPIYFETNVGEAVEVDIVRVSSRDATSLIKEETDPRRKLAGDYLFSFGAFLDARWRQNDIMWGRLDGAEQLIKTLLADEKYKKYQDELIREANEIILKETMLKESGKAFSSTVARALTFAAVEQIDKQPVVERLFKGMTPQEVEGDLINALKNSLEPAKFSENLKLHYEVDRTLDPQPTLEIISRATQIGGKILEDIAETQAQAGNRLQWVTRLGSIFWGLVTVAAPDSLGNLLLNYWLQLLYLFEVVVIIGATLLPNSAMQQFGIVAMVLTIVLHLTVLMLHDLMSGKNLLKLIFVFFIILAALTAVLGVVFTFAFVFNNDLWANLVEWHAFLDKNNYDRSLKLLFAGLLSIFVLALFGWRHARRLEIRALGMIILLFSVGMLVSGYGIKSSVSNLHEVTSAAAIEGEKTNTLSPIIALEFAYTKTDLDKIIKPAVQHSPQLDKAPESPKTDEEEIKGNIDKLKTSVFIDSFIFIPLYALTFLLLAQLLAFRRAGWFGKKTAVFLLEIEKWQKYVIDRENKEGKTEELLKSDPKIQLSMREKFVASLIFPILKMFDKNGDENQRIQIVGSPWWFQRNAAWLAWIALFLILATVAADCMENYLSYFVLDLYPNETISLESALVWKTIAAYVKFILSFVALAIVLLNFKRSFKHPWLSLLFVVSLLLPVAGIVLLAMGRVINIGFLENISSVLILLLAVQLIISILMIKLHKVFIEDF